ncbi:MAG: hypothetical protein RLZZ500_1047 [Bacteroidota bacterium]
MLLCVANLNDMLKKVLLLFPLIVVLLSAPSCARRGSITGGPKDTIAPQLLFSYPKNLSTNFSGTEIKLQFDEYIKLKDLQKQLVVSPPMNSAPEILPQTASKTLTIKIKDTLKPNTTYSFNFGQSIQDNNEGNPYSQFKYVISTGPTIDSLKLGVKIKDALERKTDNFVSVMLYEVNAAYTDSIVYNKQPQYVINTLDSLKAVVLENLKAGKYRLIAVKDVNKNNKFDPKTEKIAFQKDYISIPSDTIYELELFNEKKKFKATTTSHLKSSRLLVGYHGNIEKAEIQLLRNSEKIPTQLTRVVGKDSAEVWFKASKGDSLTLQIRKDNSSKTFGFKVRDFKKDSLSLSVEPKGTLNFSDTLRIASSIPLTNWDLQKIKLSRKDSSAVAFKSNYDSFKKEFQFLFDKEPNQKYRLEVLPGAFTDYLGNVNDTLKYTTNTLDVSEYGNLKINLERIKRFPLIVQLTDTQGKVKASAYSENSKSVSFDLIQPSKFFIRVIYDDDKDGYWTPGNYLEKRQSEEVIYHPVEVDVRSNWDVEQSVDVGG